MKILQVLGETMGLKINMHKSSVAPIWCDTVDLDHILEAFAGQQVSFLITYVGLPLTLGRQRLVHLQPIQDRAQDANSSYGCCSKIEFAQYNIQSGQTNVCSDMRQKHRN